MAVALPTLNCPRSAKPGLLHFQHPLQGHQRPAGRLAVHPITFTGAPAARFSSAQQRCGKSIRIHRRTHAHHGERKWISCSGCSCLSRLTRCNSVPMAQRSPAATPRPPDDPARRTDHVGQLDHLHGALGMDHDLDARILARNGATCWGRNIWWTLQWPFHKITRLRRIASGVLPPSSGSRRVPDGHLLQAECPWPGPCCGPSADRERTARGARRERPIPKRPGRWTTCRRCPRAGRKRPSGWPPN